MVPLIILGLLLIAGIFLWSAGYDEGGPLLTIVSVLLLIVTFGGNLIAIGRVSDDALVETSRSEQPIEMLTVSGGGGAYVITESDRHGRQFTYAVAGDEANAIHTVVGHVRVVEDASVTEPVLVKKRMAPKTNAWLVFSRNSYEFHVPAGGVVHSTGGVTFKS